MTQIQRLKSSIVNSEFGMVSSYKHIGNSELQSTEKKSKETVKALQGKVLLAQAEGVAIAYNNNSCNQKRSEHSHRSNEMRKLKTKYFSQAITADETHLLSDRKNAEEKISQGLLSTH